LSETPFRAQADLPAKAIEARPVQGFGQRPSPRLAAAAALLFGGCLLALSCLRGRRR
jgi:hypothetical protein